MVVRQELNLGEAVLRRRSASVLTVAAHVKLVADRVLRSGMHLLSLSGCSLCMRISEIHVWEASD